MKDSGDANAARKGWMGLLAKAPEGRVAALLDAAMARPDFTWLRAPEIGSTTVRGRIGGTGAPFNIGEMTVTRCALTLSSGEVGHAYIQGRRKTDAEAAALVDALMQAKRPTLSARQCSIRRGQNRPRPKRPARPRQRPQRSTSSPWRGARIDAGTCALRRFRHAHHQGGPCLSRADGRHGAREVRGATPPAPLSVTAGCVLLTLCDADTPVCLAGASDTDDMRAGLSRRG